MRRSRLKSAYNNKYNVLHTCERNEPPHLPCPWVPLHQLSLCMSSTVKAQPSSPSTTCMCRPAGIWTSGGECNRSPLIIFNTAVAERLKTKSQLRKELWGWSKPPPPPLRAEMEDEKTLDSDCICDLSPLNLHPTSVSQASTSSFSCHPSSPLLIPSSPPSPFRFLRLNCSQMCILLHQRCFSWCSKTPQQHTEWLTYNPPKKKNLLKSDFKIPQPKHHATVLKDVVINRL